MCCARVGEARALLTSVSSLLAQTHPETSFHRRRDQATFAATGKRRDSPLVRTASTHRSAPLVPPCLLGTLEGGSMAPDTCRTPASDQLRWRYTLGSSRSWTECHARTILPPKHQIDTMRLQHRYAQPVGSPVSSA
jgi:hypothetical protein